MKKKSLLITIVCTSLGLLLIGTYILSLPNSKASVQLVTQTLTTADVARSITATGTIEPVTEVVVGTQVSGIIDKIYVDYNSPVKKGQVIAEMDKVNLSNELESALANYHSLQAEYLYQKSQFDRNLTLHKKQLISDSEYESVTYNFQKAKSNMEQSKAALAKAQRNLSYATITAPIDGIVTSKSVEQGQTVASGFSTPTLFTIAADLTKMQVVADVDEADIANVQEGDSVSFTVDAYPNDIFYGKVSQVRLGSTNNSTTSTTSTTESVVTYEVIISADNQSLKLKPRLTANVTIFTETRNHVPVISNKALRFQPNPELTKGKRIVDTDSQHKVWILEGNTIKATPVSLGLSDNNNTEVLSGLTPEMQIIVGTQTKTSDTNENNIQSESNPFMPTPPGKNKNKNKQ